MATITPFNMTRDINGYNGFGLPFSSSKYSATLAQDTDTTLVVPLSAAMGAPTATQKNKYIAIFSFEPGAQVWVANNATAAKPVAASFATVSSELNPSARYVEAGDTLHFLTPDTTANVGVTFYALY